MDVVAHRAQITIAASVHNQSFIASGKKMAAEFMPNVKTFGINSQHPLHSRNQIGLRRFDDQVKMIAHQAPGMHLPLRFRASLPQSGEKTPTVFIVVENVFALVATVHDVVNRVSILDAQWPRHGQRFLPPSANVKV